LVSFVVIFLKIVIILLIILFFAGYHLHYKTKAPQKGGLSLKNEFK